MPRLKRRAWDGFTFLLLCLLSAAFLLPIFVVLLNSFKGQFYIADDPFSLPNSQTFAGLANYIGGIRKTGFLRCVKITPPQKQFTSRWCSA